MNCPFCRDNNQNPHERHPSMAARELQSLGIGRHPTKDEVKDWIRVVLSEFERNPDGMEWETEGHDAILQLRYSEDDTMTDALRYLNGLFLGNENVSVGWQDELEDEDEPYRIRVTIPSSDLSTGRL